MSSKSKALPPDINNFFAGKSSIFPPPAPSSQEVGAKSPKQADQQKDITERSNGRTVERTVNTTERSNGRFQEISVSPTLSRSVVQASPMYNGTNDNPHLGTPENIPEALGELSSTVGSEETPSRILERLRLGRSAQVEQTERYSFEIYSKQKEKIEDFLYQYKKQTGEKITASKFLREAIDLYFQLLDQHGSR